MSVAGVIWGAGQKSHMLSASPNVLHALAGQPIVLYPVAVVGAVSDVLPVLVLGDGADQIRAVVGQRVQHVAHVGQMGLAEALGQVRELLADRAESVLVVRADMPLLTEATLRRLVTAQAGSGAALSLLTAASSDAWGASRIVRDASGQVRGIATEEDRPVGPSVFHELNAGVYCFDARWLWAHLAALPCTAGEYDWTALVEQALVERLPVNAVACADPGETLAIESYVHLAEAEAVMRARINRHWMEAGVTMLDPATTYIEIGVTIGPDTLILPNTFLRGRTSIGPGCRIGPGTLIEDCTIGARCQVTWSVLEQAVMEDESNIGPFGHLRKGARLCRGAHMGNFGEMKNSTLGPGSKMGHFSYLGDATVGANVNIGAGTITCNFDGVHKHPTVIEDDVFIGSDSMLVAPVRIGRGAKTGAGSVVTHDVPAGAVAYGVPARVRRAHLQDEGTAS